MSKKKHEWIHGMTTGKALTRAHVLLSVDVLGLISQNSVDIDLTATEGTV